LARINSYLTANKESGIAAIAFWRAVPESVDSSRAAALAFCAILSIE
jgi:hypothetical protein